MVKLANQTSVHEVLQVLSLDDLGLLTFFHALCDLRLLCWSIKGCCLFQRILGFIMLGFLILFNEAHEKCGLMGVCKGGYIRSLRNSDITVSVRQLIVMLGCFDCYVRLFSLSFFGQCSLFIIL